MAICNSIPADVADQICGKLDAVANMLRAMRTITIHAETDATRDAACVAVAGLCERTHLIIDSCIIKMEGGLGLGNFADNEWLSAQAGSEEAAMSEHINNMNTSGGTDGEGQVGPVTLEEVATYLRSIRTTFEELDAIAIAQMKDTGDPIAFAGISRKLALQAAADADDFLTLIEANGVKS